MAKHVMVECHRCGKPESRTRLSRVYGCRECKAAMSDLDRKKALFDFYNANGKHLAGLAFEREHAKRVAAAKPMQDAAAETVDDVFAEARAARRSNRPSFRVKPPPSSIPQGEMTDAQVAETNKKILEAAARHEAFARVASAMQAVVPPMKRCACCDAPEPAGVVYEETFDAKVWCRMCAYGILRTGHCTPHNSTHYLDIAANTRSLSIEQYPLDVLHPFTREFFASDIPTTEIDP